MTGREGMRPEEAPAPGRMQRVLPEAPEWAGFVEHVEGCDDCLARADGSACETGTRLRRAARRATRERQ